MTTITRAQRADLNRYVRTCMTAPAPEAVAQALAAHDTATDRLSRERSKRRQAEAERDEWRQTAKDEHAAALDLIGVVKERDQRIEAVRDVLDRARDNFENVNDADIRQALDA